MNGRTYPVLFDIEFLWILMVVVVLVDPKVMIDRERREEFGFTICHSDSLKSIRCVLKDCVASKEGK